MIIFSFSYFYLFIFLLLSNEDTHRRKQLLMCHYRKQWIWNFMIIPGTCLCAVLVSRSLYVLSKMRFISCPFFIPWFYFGIPFNHTPWSFYQVKISMKWKKNAFTIHQSIPEIRVTHKSWISANILEYIAYGPISRERKWNTFYNSALDCSVIKNHSESMWIYLLLIVLLWYTSLDFNIIVWVGMQPSLKMLNDKCSWIY